MGVRRSPHGERGLKLPVHGHAAGCLASLPTRGAWIETSLEAGLAALDPRRSPHGERGLKLVDVTPNRFELQSLPTRGAWIETS